MLDIISMQYNTEVVSAVDKRDVHT